MKFYQSKATSTQSQSFIYAILMQFFFLVSRNICVRTHETMKPTQNDVVYMPDHYVML